MTNVAITGGAGFIGQSLVRRLQQQGVGLRLLSRGHSRLVAQGDTYFSDLTNETDSLEGLFDGIDVIFHCAGELENKAVMHALHVDGTSKLLQAAKAHINTYQRPLHWVQLSSVGAYGSNKGRADIARVIVETTPTAPIGEYEITKTRADDLVMEFARSESLFTYSILRPSIVIGNDMRNQSVRSLINIIRKKLFFYIGSKQAVATYIHIDDVVDALVLCGKDPKARGQIFNLSNDCMLSEIVDSAAKSAGLTPPTLCVPEKPVRVLAKILSALGMTLLTDSRIDALMKRTTYPSTKIKDILGFSPQHSIPEAIVTLKDS